MKSAEFLHLLKHYRHHKAMLRHAMVIHRIERTIGSALDMAAEHGALECLYYQAHGKGLINLAKGIRRTMKAAKLYMVAH